jgi:hypothetical protein
MVLVEFELQRPLAWYVLLRLYMWNVWDLK